MSTEDQVNNLIKKINLLIDYLVKPTINIPSIRDHLREMKVILNKILKDRKEIELKAKNVRSPKNKTT